MQAMPTPVASFSLAFKYFDKSGTCNPLLAWMKFQEEFVLRSNHEECSKCLNEFSLARDNVSVCVCVSACVRACVHACM